MNFSREEMAAAEDRSLSTEEEIMAKVNPVAALGLAREDLSIPLRDSAGFSPGFSHRRAWLCY
jgi:hypothetical protein